MAKKKKSDAEVVSDPAGKASLFTKTKDIDASLDALFSTSVCAAWTASQIILLTATIARPSREASAEACESPYT